MLLNAVVCSRVRELQEALSAATIALEISGRNARVAALQKRWDRLRAGLDLILDQRGADLADLPGGESGMLCRDYKVHGCLHLRVMAGPFRHSAIPGQWPFHVNLRAAPQP